MAELKNAQQETTSSQPQAAMTQVEAVRRCLEVLGKDATRTEIQSYVKEHFGIKITKQHATNCKGVILKRAAAKKRLARSSKPVVVKKAPPRPLVPEAAASAAPARKSGILLDDIEAIKALLGRVGVDEVRRLIELLAK